MHERRLDAQGRERAHATDAEQRVLRETGDRIRDVELRGDPPLEASVLGPIGVEQKQRHATDSHTPDLRAYLLATDRHRDRQRPPILRAHQRSGKPLGIDINPVLVLPAGGIQPLAEISLAVHQSDRHQRQRPIGSLLEQVACQTAQPARVDRQRPVNAVLGAQERDRPLRRDGPNRGRAHHIRRERLLERRRAGEQSGISGRPHERLTRRLLKQANRVLAAQPPPLLVDGAKHFLTARVPAPAIVVGDPGQRRELLREPSGEVSSPASKLIIPAHGHDHRRSHTAIPSPAGASMSRAKCTPQIRALRPGNGELVAGLDTASHYRHLMAASRGKAIR